jgi:hypothetical protein
MSAEEAVAAMTLEQLAAELTRRWHTKTPWNERSYAKLYETISPEQCARLVEILDAKYRADFHRHHGITSDIFRRWASADPTAAADAALQRWKHGVIELWQLRGLLWGAMEEWGEDDRLGATAWLKAQELPNRSLRETAARALFRGHATAEPLAAVEMLAAMSWSERNWYRHALVAPKQAPERGEFIDKIGHVVDEQTRDELFCSIYQQLFPFTMEEYEHLNLSKTDAGWDVMQTMADQTFGIERDSVGALDFLWVNAPQEARPVICSRYLAKLQKRDPAAASAWMEAHQLTDESVEASIRSVDR